MNVKSLLKWLIIITNKKEKYALDKKTNDVYDLVLAKKGILFKIGNLDPNTRKINFFNISNKHVTALRSLLTKKLKKIHKKKHTEFIENQVLWAEEEYKPGNSGYLKALTNFNLKKPKSKKKALSLSNTKLNTKKNKTSILSKVKSAPSILHKKTYKKRTSFKPSAQTKKTKYKLKIVDEF